MTKQTLIANLYNDPDIVKAIGKMNPPELREDLKQEMFLVLCQKSDEDVIRMHEEGWLKFFVVRTMLNMIKSDRSTFHKLFRVNLSEFTEKQYKHTNDEFEAKEGTLKSLTEALDSLAWYEREVLKLYSEHRNIVKLSKMTKIPYRSLFKTIQNAKLKMRTALKKDENNQAKLIGNYVTASLSVQIDITNDLHPDEIADLLSEITEMIRDKITGHSIKDAHITNVNDLKIDRII